MAEANEIAAKLRERARNMRRYPYESRTRAEAMVIAARELQDVADEIELAVRAHLRDTRHDRS